MDVNILGMNFDLGQLAHFHQQSQENPGVFDDQHVSAVNQILKSRTTSFVNVIQLTRVKTAAAYKERFILKLSSVNAQISKSHDTYTNSVKNSAEKLSPGNTNAENFKPSKSYFTRWDDCAALATGDKNGKNLLVYLSWNNRKSRNKSIYFDGDTGETMSKEEVAEFLTKSERNKLMDPPKEIKNKTAGITHGVHVRSVYLHNIVSIKAGSESSVAPV